MDSITFPSPHNGGCIPPIPTPSSKNFHCDRTWTAIEESTSSCIATALKAVLAVPLYLVEVVARIARAIGNAGAWALNGLCGRSVEVVAASNKKICDEPVLKADKPVFPSPATEELVKTETLEEPALPIVEKPPAPVLEISPPTTTTLIEKESGEDKGGWEWDVNNPDQIHVRYPEPVVPSNKNSYLTTALGVIGLAAIAVPTLYYYAGF